MCVCGGGENRRGDSPVALPSLNIRRHRNESLGVQNTLPFIPLTRKYTGVAFSSVCRENKSERENLELIGLENEH